MLNPGFSPGDYYALEKEPEYAAAIERNLAQQNAADSYPFFFLNPQFAWTAGGQWWRSKFRAIAEELARRTNIPLQQAFQRISRHVACLEMYPYHSQGFKKPGFKLKSKELMCQYVKDVIVPRAQSKEALIIAMRQAKAWALPKDSKNIISFGAVQARGAHLTLNEQGGGLAIVERLQGLS
ncbi:hypothetical protein AXW84_09640 [Hymenobacter sp. PAMC 26628]|nr:hypothetical protein AXW84_09640 [Hymenobacter sp. PAMC 26628]